MRKVNLRLLLVLVLVLLGGVGGVYAVHEYQMYRNADGLQALARERLEEGRGEEAAELMGRYISLRPNDAAAHADYARMVLKRLDMKRFNQRDYSFTFNVLETAVRKNPDDDLLREKMAGFLLRVGNFSDARQHLGLLRERRLRGETSPPKPASAGDDPAGEGEASADDEKIADDHIIDLRFAIACGGIGRYDEAAAVASKLIGFDIGTKAFDPAWEPLPECSDAYLLIADILERRYNDVDTASRVIRRLPEAYPRDAQAWLAMARWSVLHNDVGAAAIEIAKAAEIAPESPDVLFADFEIAMRTGNYSRAERVINEGMEAFADDARVIIGRADLALARGEVEKGLELLTKGADSITDNPLLLERLLDVLFGLERPDEAEPRLTALRALQGDDNPAVMWGEARLLMNRGQWAQAVEVLKKLRPTVAVSDSLTNNVDLSLAICHQNLGESDELLEASRRVLSDDPNSYQARVALATAHSQAGRTEEALAEFESLAAVQSREELAQKQLLWGPLLDLRMKDQLRRPKEDREWSRVDALVDILSQSPAIGDGQLASIRSDVLYKKGDIPAALEIAGKAHEIAPADAMLLSQYTTLLLADEQVEKARSVIDSAVAEIRNDPRVMVARARVAASQGGDTAEAGLAAVEKETESVVTKDAVAVLLSIMSIRVSQGKIAEAERIAGDILKREPGELRTHSALLELAVARKDVDKLAEYAQQIGDVAGRASPQARVAQAMVEILKVRLHRQEQMGEDSVPPPLTADDQRSLEDARNYLLEAQNDRPGWFQIEQSLAEIAGLRGDTAAAITHLQRAIAQGSVNPDTSRMLAALLRQTGRLEESREVIRTLGESAGLGSERIAADIDAEAGRFDSAIARAERITPVEDVGADHLIWFGQLLQRCGKGERAAEVLQQATRTAPERLDCWYELIRQQLRLGRQRPAEEALEEGVTKLASPDRELLSGTSNDMFGRYEKAEEAYRQATAAAPNDPRVARQLADFLVRRGQTVAARAELQRIIDMPEAEGTASLYWARRMVAQNFGPGATYRELTRICELLEKNVDAEGRLTPEDVKVEFSLLMDRDEPASWRKAVAVIDELARRQDLDQEQRVLRAWLQDRLGNWIEARETLVDIAAEPECPPTVIATLVEQLIAHGEIVSARVWATRLKTIAPDAPMTLRVESRLAIAAEDREAAAAAARRLLPESPPSPSSAGILGLVAQLVEELGFPKAADRIFADYAAASPDGIVARGAFLGRQQRTDEAMDVLEQAWGKVSEVDFLNTAVGIVAANGTSPSPAADDRLLAWCDRAIRTDPDSMMVLMTRGVVEELVGRPEDAIRTYREVLAKPNLSTELSSRAANNLASLLADSGSAEEARKVIDGAFEELGPHPNVLDTRALVSLASGDTTKAIEDLKESILVPSAPKHLHMAEARFAAREVSECRAALAAAEALGLRKMRLNAGDQRRLERLDKALADQFGG